MAENKNNNKSLFLYTGLIFSVAVILIILAFFGQKNIENKQPQVEETQTQQTESAGITERASILSEENKNLMEVNATLKKQNKELEEEIKQNNSLLAANGYLSMGNKEKALELLNIVDYEALSTDQQIIYDEVKNKIEKEK